MEQIRERERSKTRRLFDTFDEDSDDEDDSDSGGDISDNDSLSEAEDDINGDNTNTDGNDKDDAQQTAHNCLLKRVTRRAARRRRRQLKLKKGSAEQEVLKARKMIKTQNKTGQALAEALLQNQLGMGGCLACRSTACK